MPNLGEEICGEYLKYVLGCEFIAYNVTTPDIQGEIDVIGIHLESKEIYVCEVAVHILGLQYVKNKKPDDYNRFVAKFDKDIQYAKKYFPDYVINPMLWSPIVKVSGENAKYNTLTELLRVEAYLRRKYGLNLDLMINNEFNHALERLKAIAGQQSAELKSSVMRMFQIEQSLQKHLKHLHKKTRG